MRSQNYELPLIVQSEGLVEQYMEPPVATLSLCARRSAHLVAEALIASMDDGELRVVTLPHEVQGPDASPEGGVAT